MTKNYRPISLLPIISKIFEKLTNHLHNNKIINTRQFGYQPKIRSNDAIDTLIDDVIANLNNKKKVAGLFLDLSSAFGTVDHNILIKKLKYYGIKQNVLQLFKSYLDNKQN